MFSEKCTLQGRNGIKQLDRVGSLLVIVNRQLHETGARVAMPWSMRRETVRA
jgi:hypothetical protein